MSEVTQWNSHMFWYRFLSATNEYDGYWLDN